MPYDNSDDRRNRLRLRLTFLVGGFEADATGTVAIGATMLALVLMGAGRWYGLW